MYVEKWVNRSLYENDAENVAFWDFRTSITFSVSFIRLLRKLLKSRTLSYLPTCLFACLLTHLFIYTDDGVMLSGSVTGPITTSNKNKKSNDFHPKINQLTSLIFPIKMYFFFCCFLFLPAGLLRCLGAGTRGRWVESEFEREMRDNQIAREKWANW